MNTKYLIVALLLIMTRDAFAQSTDNGSPKRVEEHDSNDTTADIERLRLSEEDNLRARDATFIKGMAKMGYKVGPSQKGRKNSVNSYFEIPENEALAGCGYPKGYSYPNICTDKGRVVFDYDRGDDQKVLDKIIKEQGKQGKYNKLPKERRRSKDASSKITTTIVKEYPPQVLVPPIVEDEEEQR